MAEVTVRCVQAAAARIRGCGPLVTPVITSDFIDAQCGTRAHFKCEHLQRTGSFKLRGAANAVAELSDDVAAKGVVAHSAGNHGAALAAAAAARGIACTVVVPSDTPAAKLDNMRRHGANVVLCEPTQQARSETAAAEAERMGGATLVHPYNDPAVMAGQGTIALELLEQCASLDAILVPVSGGGMLAGIAAAARALRPELRVIACEPAGKRLGEALATGQRVIDATTANKLIPTIADAIRTQALGERPWAVAQPLVDPCVLTVDDAQIAAAMRLAMKELKQVLEPAGAVTLAALLSPGFKAMREEASGAGKPLRDVAAVMCGGNVDVDALCKVVGSAPR